MRLKRVSIKRGNVQRIWKTDSRGNSFERPRAGEKDEGT